jgi:hypothetical protein
LCLEASPKDSHPDVPLFTSRLAAKPAPSDHQRGYVEEPCNMAMM